MSWVTRVRLQTERGHTALQNLAARSLEMRLWWGSDGEAQRSPGMLLKIDATRQMCKSDTVIAANTNPTTASCLQLGGTK